MVNKLVNSLKRGLLYLSIPLALGLGSCTINKNYIDDVYYNPKKGLIVSNKEKVNSESEVPYYLRDPTVEEDDWHYSSKLKSRSDFNRYSLGWWDSDGDGIEDWADPWPNRFGPYLDTNNNGIIDFNDVKISGFGNDFWDYNFSHHSYWHNSWDYGFGYDWGSPFYHNYYWDSPFYSNYGYYPWGSNNYWNHWGNWNDWDNNWGEKKGDREIIYGHRNTSITDGPTERIYNRSSTNSREFNSSRITSPQNKSNSSNSRTATQYRNSTNSSRTNNSSAVQRYDNSSKSSSNTIQRSSSSSSSSIRSGSSSSSGATRSSSSSGSSSSTRTGRR